MRPIFIGLLMGIFFMGQENSFASFRQNQVRYFSPYDFISMLRKKFPASENANVDMCLEFTELSKNVLGAITPLSGLPFYSGPSHMFVNWYGNCLQGFIYSHLGYIEKKLDQDQIIQYLYGDKFFTYWKESHRPSKYSRASFKNYNNTEIIMVDEVHKSNWIKLPKNLQIDIIAHWARKLIGPSEVIKELTSEKSEDAFYESLLESVSRIKNKFNLKKTIEHIIFLIAMRDEFLKY